MSIGPLQVILIVVVILIFFGPKRLPNLARSIGESIRGFKKSLHEEDDSRDVTNTANEQLNGADSVQNSTVEEKDKNKV